MSASEAKPPIPAWVVVGALALLMGLQPIATDVPLPALPEMQRALGLSPSSAQWTLSVLILCFGLGQLVWGPISDRVGRRPVLRWGLSLFVVASVAATLADNFALMLMARAAQGASLSAAVMCGRAMVRDLYAPEAGARMMAKGLTGLGLIALAGPILGGLIATHAGWRANMGLVGVCGALILAFVSWKLPETLPADRRQRTLHWRDMLGNWLQIARHPTFQAHAGLTASTYGGLYVYLALSAFVFIDVLGSSRTAYGMAMASLSLCYLSGTVYCRRTLPHRGLRGTIALAGWFSLCGGLLIAAVSLTQAGLGWVIPAWSLLPGMWLYAFAHGIHQPCGQTGVVAAFPHQAGAASALSGFVLASVAFVTGCVLSWWTGLPAWSGTLYPMTLGVALGGMCTARMAWHRVQRDGMVPLTVQTIATP